MVSASNWRILRAFTLLVAFTGFVVPSLQAQQQVELTKLTKLFERPDATSKVIATLPAGLKLEKIAEQDLWIAVSTQDQRVGWIQISDLKKEVEGQAVKADSELDDLLESLEKQVEENTQTPPPPTPSAERPAQPESTPPPTPSNSGPPPPPTPSSNTQTPPPPNTDAQKPPPPPSRPPSSEGASQIERPQGPNTRVADTIEMVQAWRGRFDSANWSSLSVLVNEFTEAGQLDWANLASDKLEWGGLVNVLRTKVPAEFQEFIDPTYNFTIGGFANFFAMSPTPNSPIGIWAGPRINLNSPFQKEDTVDRRFLEWGGEVGVFARFGGEMKILPKFTIQYGKITQLNQDDQFNANVTNVLAKVVSSSSSEGHDSVTRYSVGIDFMIKGIVPGIRFMSEGEEISTYSFNLAFPF